ncbi:glutathione s-transferase [Stemphylium lycopersici]|nr:glutathione s-transferase [Stemphylium lycopersici]
MATPSIELFTAATPNGQKISIFLEELGIPYKTTPIDLSADEQKSSSFLKINPNGRIPAIVDHNRNSFAVFESGAIFLYLSEHYDRDFKFCFEDQDEIIDMMTWVFFQNAGVGPMQGQANHFVRYAPETIEYGIKRYQNETKRLYSVLNDRLRDRDYLAGKGRGKYSIADITTFTWVRWAPWAGIDLGEFPRLKDWGDRIEKREAVQKGLLVPSGGDQIEKLRKDPNVQDPFKEWVQKGQKELWNHYSVDNYDEPFASGCNGSGFVLDPHTYEYYNAYMSQNGGFPTSYKGQYSPDVTAEKAYGFLGEATKYHEPWFLTVAPIAPHSNVKLELQ